MPRILTEELSAHLVAQNLVTADRANPTAAKPSVWLNPRAGAPQPRPPELVTVTLIEKRVPSRVDMDPWMATFWVWVVVRAGEERDAILLQRTFLDLLSPRDQLHGRQLWQCNTLPVQRSVVCSEDQPAGQDETSYTRTQAFRFDCWRSDLV